MSLKQLNANAPLKIISLVLSLGFWSLFNQMHPTLLTTTIPLCFYNTEKEHATVLAPETITITLAGKRSDLACLDLTTLAAHINAETLSSGPQALNLKREHLFVPPSCNLVHYKPSNILVSVQKEITHP
jgi:hypothetical protein